MKHFNPSSGCIRRETALLSVPREKWDEVNCGELEPMIPGARDPARTAKEIRMNRNRKYCGIMLWSDFEFGRRLCLEQ